MQITATADKPTLASEPMVATGAIVALRLFDVAYAIDLARAETLLARPGTRRQPQPAERDAAQGDGIRRAAGRSAAGTGDA